MRPPNFGEDPTRPLTAEEQRRKRAAETLSRIWERAVGPLDDNPALRRALHEMVLAGEDIKGSDGSDLWKYLEDNAGGKDGLGEILDGLDGLNEGTDWDLPKFDFPSLGKWDFGGWGGNANAPDVSTPARPPSFDTGASGFGMDWFGGDSWLPVILFVAVALGALLLWRFRLPSEPQPEEDAHAAGLGPWPVDPRRLASREDVVKAFEYLSVLRYGEDAKVWNHVTISFALGSPDALARLYALSRYAPGSEPLSPDDLLEARRLVCQLAGVATA